MIFLLPRWWFVVYTCQKGKSVAKRWLCLCSQLLQKKHALAIVCLLQISCTCVKLITCFFQLSVVFIFIPSLLDDACGFLQCLQNPHYFLAMLSWRNFAAWLLLFFPFWRPLALCYPWFFQCGYNRYEFLDTFRIIELEFRNAWNKTKLENICNWSSK